MDKSNWQYLADEIGVANLPLVRAAFAAGTWAGTTEIELEEDEIEAEWQAWLNEKKVP